jgi:hypothetical protein
MEVHALATTQASQKNHPLPKVSKSFLQRKGEMACIDVRHTDQRGTPARKFFRRGKNNVAFFRQRLLGWVRPTNWPSWASSENLLANPTGVSISMDGNFSLLKLLVLRLLGFVGPR